MFKNLLNLACLKSLKKMKLAFFEKAEYNVHVHALKLFYKVVLRKKIIQPPSPCIRAYACPTYIQTYIYVYTLFYDIAEYLHKY